MLPLGLMRVLDVSALATGLFERVALAGSGYLSSPSLSFHRKTPLRKSNAIQSMRHSDGIAERAYVGGRTSNSMLRMRSPTCKHLSGSMSRRPHRREQRGH